MPNQEPCQDLSGDLILQIEAVTKTFDDTPAVDCVDLAVKRGEFVTLLGPSGCGKSTLLRMIAGFETPSAGRIMISGRDISRLAPYDREIGMVFQHLALFPHMNVYDNVAFGLRARGRTDGMDARVREMLALVGLEGFEARRTGQISGGQRQRVALARSLVTRPALLLLDEPLSALDLKLRRQLQVELKRIQQETGITFIFVTHDQEEALSMSDRIAVMNQGRVEQFGTSVETYHYPRTEFVARFVGETNLLKGVIVESDTATALLEISGTRARVPMPVQIPGGAPSLAGQTGQVMLSIRPEHVTLGAPDEHPVPAQVRAHSFSGATITYTLDSAAGPLLAQVAFQPGGPHPLPAGEAVSVGWLHDSITTIPA